MMTLTVSSVALVAEDSKEKNSNDTPAMSLELLEYLAEFSEKDGTVVDPQTFESISPKAQIQCEVEKPSDKLPKQGDPIETIDPIIAALCMRSAESAKGKKQSDKLKPEDDA